MASFAGELFINGKPYKILFTFNFMAEPLNPEERESVPKQSIPVTGQLELSREEILRLVEGKSKVPVADQQQEVAVLKEIYEMAGAPTAAEELAELDSIADQMGVSANHLRGWVVPLPA